MARRVLKRSVAPSRTAVFASLIGTPSICCGWLRSGLQLLSNRNLTFRQRQENDRCGALDQGGPRPVPRAQHMWRRRTFGEDAHGKCYHAAAPGGTGRGPFGLLESTLALD